MDVLGENNPVAVSLPQTGHNTDRLETERGVAVQCVSGATVHKVRGSQ